MFTSASTALNKRKDYLPHNEVVRSDCDFRLLWRMDWLEVFEGDVELFCANVGLPGAKIRSFEARVGLVGADASGVFVLCFRHLHAAF
nr:hypothetical protein [Tanacetum cinerariifolium]